jgi:hypothetical protein
VVPLKPARRLAQNLAFGGVALAAPGTGRALGEQWREERDPVVVFALDFGLDFVAK